MNDPTQERRGSHQAILKHYFLPALLFRHTRSTAAMVAVVLGVFSLFPALVFLVTWLEDTLRLEGGGGLYQHYGSLSQFLGYPILTLLSFRMLRKVADLLNNLHLFVDADEGEAPETLLGFRREDLLAPLRRERVEHDLFFYTMMLIGFISWVKNAVDTLGRNVVERYSHDVWDSWEHTGGYIVGRLFLAFAFIYVLPTVFYWAACSMRVILTVSRKIVSHGRITVSPFDPDRCGGFRILGQTMLAMVSLYVPLIIMLLAHVLTHGVYVGLVVPVTVGCIAVLAQLFLPFVMLHEFLRDWKERYLSFLHKQLRQNEPELQEAEPQHRLAHLKYLVWVKRYEQISKLRTWPYSVGDWLMFFAFGLLVSILILLMLWRAPTWDELQGQKLGNSIITTTNDEEAEVTIDAKESKKDVQKSQVGNLSE